MPIVSFITDQLLAMASLESINHGPPELADRIVSDFNRAIDLMGDLNPAVFFQVRTDQAELINAPVTLTVTVTSGAKTITIPSGYDPDWMAGCAILIEGDDDINRLANPSASNSPLLEQPYLGTTGSHTATVWHDWIRLPENVENIMDPIVVDNMVLSRAQSLETLGRRWQRRNGTWDYSGPIPYFRWEWNKPVDDPWRWHEASREVQGDLIAGIMLDSLPPARTKFSYTAKVGIERVSTLQDTREYITPKRKDHEILLPMVRWFFASHMSVSIPKQQLQDDFEIARQSAANLTITSNSQKKFIYPKNR